jgi:hypothetical protein
MAVEKSNCGCGEHRGYRLDVDCDCTDRIAWNVVDENEAVESKTVENKKPALEMTEIY